MLGHLQRRPDFARDGPGARNRADAPADRGVRAQSRRRALSVPPRPRATRRRAARACRRLAALPAGAVIPMWASHGDGRLAASPDELDRLAGGGHVAFVYCDAAGQPVAAPQGSALDCAALTNGAGTVVAIMPHPERDAWTFMHRDGAGQFARAWPKRGDAGAVGRQRVLRAFAAVAGSGLRAMSEPREGVRDRADDPRQRSVHRARNAAPLGSACRRSCGAPISGVRRRRADAANALADTIATIETIFNPNKHGSTSGRRAAAAGRGVDRAARRSGRAARRGPPRPGRARRPAAGRLAAARRAGEIVDPRRTRPRRRDVSSATPRFRKQYDEDVYDAPMSMMVETQRDPADDETEPRQFYTIATLGSHSALQILKGAHDEGFRTLAIANARHRAAVSHRSRSSTK